MNYKKIYDSICNRAKDRKIEGYVERHHIIPKSKGGSNDSSNIVELTAREHLLCHWLLARHTGDHRDWFAFKAMITLRTKDQIERPVPSLRMVAEARENAHNHPEHIKRNKEWNTGRKHTKETRAKMKKDWATNPNRNYWNDERRRNRSLLIKKRLNGNTFYDASGTKWMNNGEVSKMVKKEHIPIRLEEGFVFGRKLTEVKEKI